VPRPKRLTEVERRDLLVRRGELAALGRHPAWDVFVASVEERILEMERQTLAITLHGGEETPIPTDRILYMRGYIAGMRWALGVPSLAQTQLERDTTRQQGVAA